MATTVLTTGRAMSGRGNWETQPCQVDITGWEQKVRNVKEVQARVCKQVVDWGLDELMKRTVQNVTGPFYGYIKGPRGGRTPARGPLTNAGRLPVPVVTGQLLKSIKPFRFNTVFGAVWSDSRLAKYNVFVHNGVPGKMQPRPFLQAAVDQERPRILEYMKKRILEEIQKVGGQGSLGF